MGSGKKKNFPKGHCCMARKERRRSKRKKEGDLNYRIEKTGH